MVVTPAFTADYFGPLGVGPIFGFMLLPWAFTLCVWSFTICLPEAVHHWLFIRWVALSNRRYDDCRAGASSVRQAATVDLDERDDMTIDGAQGQLFVDRVEFRQA